MGLRRRMACGRTPLCLAVLAALVVVLGRPEVALATTHVSTTTYSANTEWTTAGSPYVLDGNVTVASGVTLTIDPGVIVKFNGTFRTLTVNGTLTANGTQANPITFTSYQDDSVGGDTNGDGNATTPAAGQWSSVTVSGSGASASFTNVVASYGGYGSAAWSAGELSIQNGASATVTSSTVKTAQAAGIYLYNGASVTVDSTSLTTNGDGIADTGSAVTVRNRTLVTNNSQDGTWFSLQSSYAGATSSITGSDVANNGRYGVYLNVNGDMPLGKVPHGSHNNIDGNASGQLYVSGYPFFKQANVNWKFNYWGSTVGYITNPGGCAGSSPNASGRLGVRGTGTPPSTTPMSGGSYAVGQNLCGYDSFRIDPTEMASAPLWDGNPSVDSGQTLGGDGLSVVDAAINPGSSESDPVTGATGNALDGETDLQLPGIGVPFRFTRTYNSADVNGGVLGTGWTFSYNSSLTINSNGDVIFRSDTGQELFFAKQPDGSFVSDAGGRATLTSIQGGYELVDHNQLHLRFDSSGNLTSIKDRNGEGLTMSYTGSQLTSITDSASRQITLTYSSGLLSQVSLPDGRHVSYGYTNGLLTSVTDARGKVWTYGYDSHNLLASETDPNGHKLFQNTYGSDGRVTDQYDALNHHTTFAWDPSTQTSTITDARGNAWKEVFSNGVLIKRIDPLGNTTTYGYDADLNPTSVADARGKTTTMTYDSRGNLLTRTAPSPLSYQEIYTYDSLNDLLTARDGRGNTTSYSYDTAGNLSSITRPGSIVTQYGRDPTTGLVTSVTDPRGKVTHYDYDTAGDLTAITTSLGTKTTMVYDASGRLSSSVDPRGNVTGGNPDTYRTSYTYNPNDQLLTRTDPLGNAWTYAYDDAGNLTSVTDPKNHVTSYAYNADNQLTTVTAPDNSTTTYTYDGIGNITGRTDANNHTTTYSYDTANRLTGVTNPLNKTWSLAYDANGNPTQVTKPSGGTISVGYDELNRPTGLTYSDSTHAVTFSYDANSNRTQMTDGAGTQTYSYDALNRLTGVTRGSDTFGYSYDDAGNVTLRTYPDATSTAYTYDDDERLASATRSGNTTNYSYDPAAELTQVTLPNGSTETRSYDAAGRLTEIKHTIGSSTLAQFDYAYDPAGNPTSVTTPTGVTTYSYDNRDRLTGVCYQSSCPGSSDPFIRWTYDPVGNRLTEARPAGTTTYSYDSADELTQAGSTSYAYNANGDQTQAGSRTFSWNIADQLTSTTNSGATTSYSYDGDGNRLQASSSSRTTNYLWDTNASLPRLALERDGTGSTLRSYEYGLGLISMLTGGQNYYFHRDGVGSIINVTSSTGQTEWTYSYEPFGNAQTTTKNDSMAPDNTARFAGQLLDSDSGLYDLRARSYDANTGRFLSLDARPSSVGRPVEGSYTYASDSPALYTDPSGLGPALSSPTIADSIIADVNQLKAGLGGSCVPSPAQIPKIAYGDISWWIWGYETACKNMKALLAQSINNEDRFLAGLQPHKSTSCNFACVFRWGVDITVLTVSAAAILSGGAGFIFADELAGSEWVGLSRIGAPEGIRHGAGALMGIGGIGALASGLDISQR